LLKSIVLFGGPGSGKGEQNRLFAEDGYFIVETGEMIRERSSRDPDFAVFAEEMGAGLFPDDVVFDLARERLSNMPTNSVRGVVFDGIPRNVEQCAIIPEIIREFQLGRIIPVHIDVEHRIRVDRMIKRKRSGETRQMIEARQKVYEEETLPVLAMIREMRAYFKPLRTVSPHDPEGHPQQLHRMILDEIGGQQSPRFTARDSRRAYAY